nr:hypothetical protein [uncultured Roseococcus sp.]
MATNMRTALASAVVARLQAVIPTVAVERGRRAAVGEGERPLILVETADATADDEMSPSETFWTLTFTATAFLVASRGAGATGAQADVAAEDALGDMEAAIIAALHAESLSTPGGTAPLTCGVEIAGSQIDITEAASAAKRLGSVSVDFRAQIVLPVGTTIIP